MLNIVVKSKGGEEAVTTTAKQQNKKKAYINFRAQVRKESIDMLMGQLGNLITQGFDDITLIVSSTGGQVQPALDFYDFAKKLPIALSTYALGQVASAAIVVYCAADNRSAHDRAKFLIHGIRGQYQGYSIKDLEKKITPGLREQSAKIADIIAKATGANTDKVMEDMETEKELSAKQAREQGLINAGIDNSPIKLAGVPILTIGDDLIQKL